MRRGEAKRLPRLRDGEGGREQGRGTVTETVTELSTGAECYGRDERFGI